MQRRPEARYREQAIQVFRDAIAAGVDSPLIYGNLARNLLESGRFEEGAEATRQVLRLLGDPALRERVRDRNMAIAYHHRQEYAKADEIFTRLALKVPLKEVQNISDLAFVKMSLGHFDEAIAVYDAGLALLPKSCNLWQELGLAYAARGKPGDIDTALATFDKGITAVPKCGLTYNAAARLLIKAGRLPEARKKLDALIKIAPKSDGAVIAKEILASVAGKG